MFDRPAGPPRRAMTATKRGKKRKINPAHYLPEPSRQVRYVAWRHGGVPIAIPSAPHFGPSRGTLHAAPAAPPYSPFRAPLLMGLGRLPPGACHGPDTNTPNCSGTPLADAPGPGPSSAGRPTRRRSNALGNGRQTNPSLAPCYPLALGGPVRDRRGRRVAVLASLRHALRILQALHGTLSE